MRLHLSCGNAQQANPIFAGPNPPLSASKKAKLKPQHQDVVASPPPPPAEPVDPTILALRSLRAISENLRDCKVTYTRRMFATRRRLGLTPVNMSCFIARFYSLLRARDGVEELAWDAGYEADVSALDKVLFPAIQHILGAVDSKDVDAFKPEGSDEVVHVIPLRDEDVSPASMVAMFCLDGFEVVVEHRDQVFELETFYQLIGQESTENMAALGRTAVVNKYKGDVGSILPFVAKMEQGVHAVGVGQ